MAKTYVPTLRLIVHRAVTYMSQWQTFIEPNLTPDQVTAFRDCLACLIDLAGLLGPEPISE